MYTVRATDQRPAAVVATTQEATDDFEAIMTYASGKLGTQAVSVQQQVIEAKDCVIVHRRGEDISECVSPTPKTATLVSS